MLQLFWWASRPHNLCLRSRVSNKPVSVFESGVLSRPSSSPYCASLTKRATFERSSESTEPRICELAIRNLTVGLICLDFQTEPSKESLVCWPPFKGNEESGYEAEDKIWTNTTKFAVWLNDFELFLTCRYIYSVEYGRVVDTKAGHDDASKCLSLVKEISEKLN